MVHKSNGFHSSPEATVAERSENPNNQSTEYASGAVLNQYPSSSIASLLDSQLAHRTLKYGIEMATFALMNAFFPKRTSWVARVALPLAVNYVLGRWIEENYDQWVATLAQKEYERKSQASEPTAAS